MELTGIGGKMLGAPPFGVGVDGGRVEMGLTGMGGKLFGAPPFGVGADVVGEGWEGRGRILAGVGAVGLVTLRSGGLSDCRRKMFCSTS
jgi:hypothetical protein